MLNWFSKRSQFYQFFCFYHSCMVVACICCYPIYLVWFQDKHNILLSHLYIHNLSRTNFILHHTKMFDYKIRPLYIKKHTSVHQHLLNQARPRFQTCPWYQITPSTALIKVINCIRFQLIDYCNFFYHRNVIFSSK